MIDKHIIKMIVLIYVAMLFLIQVPGCLLNWSEYYIFIFGTRLSFITQLWRVGLVFTPDMVLVNHSLVI